MWETILNFLKSISKPPGTLANTNNLQDFLENNLRMQLNLQLSYRSVKLTEEYLINAVRQSQRMSWNCHQNIVLFAHGLQFILKKILCIFWISSWSEFCEFLDELSNSLHSLICLNSCETQPRCSPTIACVMWDFEEYILLDSYGVASQKCSFRRNP